MILDATSQVWDVIRWFSACLSMTAAALMIASYMARYDTPSYTPRLRRAVPWVIVLLLVITYGCGEAAASHAEGGLRVLLLPLALAGLTASLLIGFREDH